MLRKLLILALVIGIVFPTAALAQPGVQAPVAQKASAPNAVIPFTVLHTNDFHGNLEENSVSGYPGMARTAAVIKGVQAAVGETNTLLLDGGDMMQGTLLSNVYKGVPTIDVYNSLGYAAATFGNHEFDWGQTTLISRTNEANFPFLAANVVVNDTGNCATAGWTSSSFARPWTIATIGADGREVNVGIIGSHPSKLPISPSQPQRKACALRILSNRSAITMTPSTALPTSLLY